MRQHRPGPFHRPKWLSNSDLAQIALLDTRLLRRAPVVEVSQLEARVV
jgi:hypothetical protein